MKKKSKQKKNTINKSKKLIKRWSLLGGSGIGTGRDRGYNYPDPDLIFRMVPIEILLNIAEEYLELSDIFRIAAVSKNFRDLVDNIPVHKLSEKTDQITTKTMLETFTRKFDRNMITRPIKLDFNLIGDRDINIDDYLNRIFKNSRKSDELSVIQRIEAHRPELKYPKCILLSVNYSNIDDKTLLLIAERTGETLEKIELLGCNRITETGFKNFLEIIKEKGTNNLKHLDLSDIQTLNDSWLDLISINLPEIIELNLNSCVYISNDGIRNLATHCKKLKSLSINIGELPHFPYGRFTQLDITALRHLVDNGIDLTSLELNDFNVNNVMLDLISIGFPNLKKLIISNNSEIDSSGIKHLEKLKKLEELNLETFDNRDNTNKVLDDLIDELPNLKILNITGYDYEDCDALKMKYSIEKPNLEIIFEDSYGWMWR